MSNLLRKRQAEPEECEAIECRILFVGSPDCGKTSIIQRYTRNTFSEEKQSSPRFIGIDPLDHLELEFEPPVKFVIWDSNGAEAFECTKSSVFRSSHIIVVVYAIDDEQSFSTAERWLKKIRKARGSNCITMLVGNKFDRAKDAESPVVKKSQGENLSERYDCKLHIQTSAKTNAAVRDIFSKVPEIYAQEPGVFAGAQSVIRLEPPSSTSSSQTSKKCSC